MNKRVKRGGNAQQRRVTMRAQLRECGRRLTKILKRRQKEMAREEIITDIPDVFAPGDDLQAALVADGAIEFNVRLAWDKPNAAVPAHNDPTPDWPVYDELEDERPVAEPIEFDSPRLPESVVPFGFTPNHQFGVSREMDSRGWDGRVRGPVLEEFFDDRRPGVLDGVDFGSFGDFEPGGFKAAVAASQAASQLPESLEAEVMAAKPSWLKRAWARLFGVGNSPLQ